MDPPPEQQQQQKNSTTTSASSKSKVGVANYYAILGVGDRLVWKHEPKQNEELCGKAILAAESVADELELEERFIREIVQVAIVAVNVDVDVDVATDASNKNEAALLIMLDESTTSASRDSRTEEEPATILNLGSYRSVQSSVPHHYHNHYHNHNINDQYDASSASLQSIQPRPPTLRKRRRYSHLATTTLSQHHLHHATNNNTNNSTGGPRRVDFNSHDVTQCRSGIRFGFNQCSAALEQILRVGCQSGIRHGPASAHSGAAAAK
jgi:hypothetical protein